MVPGVGVEPTRVAPKVFETSASAIPLPDPIYEKTRQRIAYNPLASHDYTVDQPSLREILPGHFVHCNDVEEARYKEELGL